MIVFLWTLVLTVMVGDVEADPGVKNLPHMLQKFHEDFPQAAGHRNHCSIGRRPTSKKTSSRTTIMNCHLGFYRGAVSSSPGSFCDGRIHMDLCGINANALVTLCTQLSIMADTSVQL